MSERILQRVACPETSTYFRELHRVHGVDIREGLGLERLIGKDRVKAAAFSDGSQLEVDFVVVGVGIAPNTDLAEAAGVAVENGITTDARGQTSVPGIWAAGDCASCPLDGKHIRIESVGNAIDQAELVAANILGAGKDYQPKPWFWSDQFDVKLQMAGLLEGYTSLVVRQTDTARSHWYYKEAELIAVVAANDPRNYMIGKRLIEAGKSPAPEAVADPDTDMKALLK